MTKNLALFDFDGTISSTDSTDLFLKRINNKWYFYFIKYFLTLHIFLFYKIGLSSYINLKNIRICYLLRGFSKENIEIKASYFSKEIIPTIVRNSAIARIKWHILNNDDIYVVSASFDILLKDWCNSNGIKLITNEFDFEGLLNMNVFKKPDCNGLEKVIRITSLLNLNEYRIIYAYGDTKMDFPMLQIANERYYQFFKD